MEQLHSSTQKAMKVAVARDGSVFVVTVTDDYGNGREIGSRRYYGRDSAEKEYSELVELVGQGRRQVFARFREPGQQARRS